MLALVVVDFDMTFFLNQNSFGTVWSCMILFDSPYKKLLHFFFLWSPSTPLLSTYVRRAAGLYVMNQNEEPAMHT